MGVDIDTLFGHPVEKKQQQLFVRNLAENRIFSTGLNIYWYLQTTTTYLSKFSQVSLYITATKTNRYCSLETKEMNKPNKHFKTV